MKKSNKMVKYAASLLFLAMTLQQVEIYAQQWEVDAEDYLFVTKGSRIGIGSEHPDAELTVNGEIRATAFKVSNEIPADYVFQKYYTGSSELLPDYTMPTLKEVEDFVKTHHHLPGIPAAETIRKEGLDAGKMTNMILQKTEELTLYLMEQRKKLEYIRQQRKKQTSSKVSPCEIKLQKR
ncbi:hypothetical protein [Sinomicrobium sp.]